MNTQIDTLLEALKAARERLGVVKMHRDEMLEIFKQDPEYVALSDACTLHAEEIATCEAEIKELALTEYVNTLNKKPHEKVSIKIFKTFKIVNPARVLAWVKTNLADALVYDEGKVKNYATKIGAVEGTELAEEARAQIASEL